jgi:hypothetical protein
MTSRTIVVLWALALLGCQSVSELSGLGPEAKTRIGQLRYATSKNSVVGDIVLRSLTAGDYDLSFSKTGVSVLQLQTRGGNMTATGLMARGGWSGPADHAPPSLKPWAMLKEVLPYFDTNVPSAQSSNRWFATFERQKGNLSKADVKFSRDGSMTFTFAQ